MTRLKIVYALLMFGLFYSTGRGQELTTARGEPILPKAKDWGISLDATKLIKNISFEYLSSSQAISGKYFTDARTAHRFALRLGVNNWTSKAYTPDRAAAGNSIVAYPAINPIKENKWVHNSLAIGLSYGIEKRRGEGRLQGIYGVEGGFYISRSRDLFTYGNALNPLSTTSLVVVDTTGDAMRSPVFGKAFNIDATPSIQGVSGAARALDRKNGTTFSVGMRAFAGAEFFVLPRLSVGGEFGWGLGFSISGRSETVWESVGTPVIPGGGSSATSVKKTTVDGPQSFRFGLDGDNGNVFGGASATVRVNVYF